jgi:hypothetical protein
VRDWEVRGRDKLTAKTGAPDTTPRFTPRRWDSNPTAMLVLPRTLVAHVFTVLQSASEFKSDHVAGLHVGRGFDRCVHQLEGAVGDQPYWLGAYPHQVLAVR